MPVVEKNTPRGRMRVSSPEATALEIVGYADHCGGLDNVAGVLAELVDELDSGKLAKAARLCPIAWTQRLGYLLDLIEQRTFADALVTHVREHASAVAPLVRAKPSGRAPRNERWKLAVNASVEPDT
jgi:predicted transcriptional regulator of viral defense system